LDLLFGSAVTQSAELNIETDNFETENVIQFMLRKYEGVKGICELIGDSLYENIPN
jgi:hypothetical protein